MAANIDIVFLADATPGLSWISITAFFSFWISAFGWGRLLAWLTALPLLELRTISVISGLAVLNILGGWLNVAGIATTTMLMALMILGVIFAMVEICRSFSPERMRKKFAASRPIFGSRSRIWPAVLAAAAGVATAVLVVPVTVFNPVDDFWVYVPRVMRMVQSGTLAGNPFDSIGFDSLGTQSLFHGFFLPEIDVRTLHAFDAVGCFALALLTIAEISAWWRIPAPWGVLAVAVAIFINPQSVNVSSLFSSVAVSMAVLIAGSAWIQQLATPRPRHGWRLDLLLCLLVASLFTLKVTIALFASLYVAALLLAAWLSGVRFRNVAKSGSRVVLLTAALLSPWMLLHLPTIYRARKLAALFPPEGAIPGPYDLTGGHGLQDLLSLRPLFWGGSLWGYHLVVGGCLLGAVLAWILWRKGPALAHRRALVSASAGGIAVIATYLLNAHLFTVDDAVRYTCPALIAAASIIPMCVIKFARVLSPPERRIFHDTSGAVMVLIFFAFASNLMNRAAAMARTGGTLSFPVSSEHLEHSRKSISSSHTLDTRKWLEATEPGSTVLLWTATPFSFDYGRNRLLSVSEPGLVHPGIAFPAGLELGRLPDYLRGFGVRYVLLQHSGTGVKSVELLREQQKSPFAIHRKLADYSIYFRESLMNLAAQSRTVQSNDVFVLFDLGNQAQAPKSQTP